ncbi:hypothetical protein CTEN210_10251 [Chaetoceros tenuissimus]|uniref:Circumsporozoite protein n=1 Tax=Chaetoceros tenuissimus TaxID=426638 RepID=A0AAD3CZB3_9STRA|nr:hypothetical protein CTEN210_10251 [Chaetoceros tenuissimus]
MKILKLSSLYLLSLAQTTFTYAQDDVCSCSPSIYKWTLDFSSSCSYTGFPDPDGSIGIEIGPDEGVRDASCQITMENQLTSEAFMTPVKVTGYQIIEQDASATALKTVSESDLELTDGAIIEYTSFTTMAGLEVEDYPFFLFVIVFAENANGEEIQLETLVKFSGTCALEVFGNGDTIGWLKFEGSVPAQDQYCGISSEAPSFLPSSSPTSSPTASPTASPTPNPTNSPSVSPSASPSVSPSIEDSSVPTETPSASPSVSPSIEDSSVPTETPSVRPTFMPSPSPSKVASDIPSSSPTTSSPSVKPSPMPSFEGSAPPTTSQIPTISPSKTPTLIPTNSPSKNPTDSPAHSIPIATPVSIPSQAPSSKPSSSGFSKGKGGKSSKSLKSKNGKSSKATKGKKSKSIKGIHKHANGDEWEDVDGDWEYPLHSKGSSHKKTRQLRA